MTACTYAREWSAKEREDGEAGIGSGSGLTGCGLIHICKRYTEVVAMRWPMDATISTATFNLEVNQAIDCPDCFALSIMVN